MHAGILYHSKRDKSVALAIATRACMLHACRLGDVLTLAASVRGAQRTALERRVGVCLVELRYTIVPHPNLQRRRVAAVTRETQR